MIYKVPVLKEEFDGVKEYFIVKLNDKVTYVPKHPYQIKFDSHPKEIEVEDVIDDSGNSCLRQTLSSLIEDCYESGCSYPFTICGKSMDGSHTFYFLTDDFGFKHRLYDNCILDNIPDDSVGTVIECSVSSIKGSKLVLRYSQSQHMDRSEAMQKYSPGEVSDFTIVSIERDLKTRASYLCVKGR